MVVVFELFGDYGHFSHPATIYSSLTYPIPPKTAIIGFLAAVGGLESFKEYEFLNKIEYSIKINSLKGKRSFCFNGVKDALPSIKETTQLIKQRKQFYRELLVNPSYKVYVDFSQCEGDYTKIVENLKNHISLFQPYLGINLCVADFLFLGEFEKEEKESSEFVDLHSFLPLPNKFDIELDKNYSDIRVATFVEEKRVFGGFTDLLVELNGNTIKSLVPKYCQVADERVVFI